MFLQEDKKKFIADLLKEEKNSIIELTTFANRAVAAIEKSEAIDEDFLVV